MYCWSFLYITTLVAFIAIYTAFMYFSIFITKLWNPISTMRRLFNQPLLFFERDGAFRADERLVKSEAELCQVAKNFTVQFFLSSFSEVHNHLGWTHPIPIDSDNEPHFIKDLWWFLPIVNTGLPQVVLDMLLSLTAIGRYAEILLIEFAALFPVRAEFSWMDFNITVISSG